MTRSLSDIHGAAAALFDGARLCDDALLLQLGDCTLQLRSNSVDVIETLRDYFSHVLTAEAEHVDIEMVAIEREAPELEIDFTDWKREPGKSGRKDTYHDLPGARLVRKVRTGMVFLQSQSLRIAAGPCLKHDNQVINFINSQYMNLLQQRDWRICHASGLVFQGEALAIAGFSGGGKSTLMLRLLDDDRVSYLTNDRLFIRPDATGTRAVGIPKLPRINPGTIVHNPRLHPLIPDEQRRQLLALPADELWHLEQKYDVHIDRIYGAGRIKPAAPLNAFLVLNWQRDSGQSPEVVRVDPAQRPDLLGAIMKSPGPFYQYSDGSFFQDTTQPAAADYLEVLDGVNVFEARGRVDFDALASHCLNHLMQE